MLISKVTSEQIPVAAASRFFDEAVRAIAKFGSFNVAVSGGKTPTELFRLLPQEEFNEWDKVNFLWVDERWVSVESEESNYGVALRAGLNKLNANFFPFNFENESPESSCEKYIEQVNKKLGTNVRLDLLILGVGEDGHTASIFKENLLDSKVRRLVFATKHPDTQQARLSLTLHTLLVATNTLILISGSVKQRVLKRLLTDDKLELPIEYVIKFGKSVTVLTDLVTR
jgi:6-phosphogluconolactonase